VFYYAKQYAPLVEDISLHYATNIAKKFRFANRVTRIGKLNDIAEAVFERIKEREEVILTERTEKLHNENIKIFASLLSAIDENMGKLKITRIDVNVGNANTPKLDDPDVMRKMITDQIRKYTGQLPTSVEANFTEVTDYDKCAFSEEWTNQTFCRYHKEQCKVQTNELKICPLFLNKVLLNNREYLAQRYVNNDLSVRTIAELAGCKELNERTIGYVRDKLREFGLWRTPRGGDSGELPSISS
jgi:hypothetical protein